MLSGQITKMGAMDVGEELITDMEYVVKELVLRNIRLQKEQRGTLGFNDEQKDVMEQIEKNVDQFVDQIMDVVKIDPENMRGYAIKADLELKGW